MSESEPAKRSSLYTVLMEHAVAQLRNAELREALVSEILTPIMHTAALRKLKMALYAILLLLLVMLTLLVIQTIQMTLYLFAQPRRS
jgi:hypothetical protein